MIRKENYMHKIKVTENIEVLIERQNRLADKQAEKEVISSFGHGAATRRRERMRQNIRNLEEKIKELEDE